jgi:cytochrome c556
MKRLIMMSAALMFANGCNTAPPPPPFKPVADVKQLMASVIEPAADEYWDAVGTVLDAEGVHEITPQTQEDWDATRNHAYVFTEAGNLLMMPTRAKDNGDWMKFSQALIDTGLKAVRAAEARDRDAVFDAGAEVYDACTQCHAKYALELQQKNFRQ